MVAAIEKLDPAFSIYTGDVVAHDIWSVNKSEALDDFNATYSLLDRLSPVYAAVGNHDSAPVNIFPPTSDPDNEWAYQALFSDWEELSTSITSRTPHGSYTSLTRDKKLKIISYNSIFYYTLNFAMYTDPMANDPANQLKWLLDELDSAESASQRVWLIAHIPTGNSDHLRDQSDYLDRIINRYSETISALFFGHTHKDQFQVSYSDYDNRNSDTASAIGYVAPSLTPTSGLPAFRVYEIDPETYAVLDYTMYVANITAEGFQEGPEWVEYYSAKKAYGSHVGVGSGNGAELTPAFWHNVTVAMEGDDAVFEAWLSRTTRGVDVPDCDADCKKAKICQLRGGDAVYNCHKATPGLSINKRDTDTGPECDEGGSGALLARMFTMYR